VWTRVREGEGVRGREGENGTETGSAWERECAVVMGGWHRYHGTRNDSTGNRHHTSLERAVAIVP
jgi:hypothetical protein